MFDNFCTCNYSQDGASLFSKYFKHYEFPSGILNYSLNHSEIFKGDNTICITGPHGSGKSLLLQNLLAECIGPHGLCERVIYLDTDLSFDLQRLNKILRRQIGVDTSNVDILVEESKRRILYVPVYSPLDFLTIVKALELYLMGDDGVKILLVDSLTFWPTKSSLNSTNMDPMARKVLLECNNIIHHLKKQYSLLFIYTGATTIYSRVISIPVVTNTGEHDHMVVPLEFVKERVELEKVNLGPITRGSKTMLIRVYFIYPRAVVAALYRNKVAAPSGSRRGLVRDKYKGGGGGLDVAPEDDDDDGWPLAHCISPVDFKFKRKFVHLSHGKKIYKFQPIARGYSVASSSTAPNTQSSCGGANISIDPIITTTANSINTKIDDPSSTAFYDEEDILLDEIEDTDSDENLISAKSSKSFVNATDSSVDSLGSCSSGIPLSLETRHEYLELANAMGMMEDDPNGNVQYSLANQNYLIDKRGDDKDKGKGGVVTENKTTGGGNGHVSDADDMSGIESQSPNFSKLAQTPRDLAKYFRRLNRCSLVSFNVQSLVIRRDPIEFKHEKEFRLASTPQVSR